MKNILYLHENSLEKNICEIQRTIITGTADTIFAAVTEPGKIIIAIFKIR